ncbi:MAG: hypothetical protein QMD00_00965 [Hadesarchaea archaeon]|nr:hypothetical protein [Hadesarchaea archaeon]
MFFKRIFRKPPPPGPAVEKLSLADLHKRVEKLKVEKLERAKPQLKAVLDETTKQREALLNELKTLADAKPTEEVHPGLMKSATEARKLLIEKMTRALADIKPPSEFSTTALVAFDGKLTKATNLTTDAVVTHGRYVRTVFEPGFAPVQSRLRGLHEQIRQSHTIIEGVIHESKTLDPILSEVDSLTGLVENAERTQDDIKSLEGQTKEIGDALKEKRDRLTELTSSEEFKRATDSARQVDQIKQEINRVKSEAVSAFSDLNRPLRKLEKLVASGGHQMDRELIKALKSCIDNPTEIIFSDEKISAAEALLRETSKLLSERKIDLSDRERRKKLERAQKLAAGLSGYKKRLDSLNQKLEAQAHAMAHPVQKHVAELEQSISQHESKLKQTKTEIEELECKLKRMKDEIEEKRVKLEGLASEILGTKVELTF